MSKQLRVETATVMSVNTWNKTVNIRFKGVAYFNVPMRNPRVGAVSVIVQDSRVVILE